jgi:AraC-like DNA-binding protein
MRLKRYTETLSISRWEQSLLDLERLLGIQITIHDIGNVFRDGEGRQLLGKMRQSHQRYIICKSRFGERCIRHCGEAVHKKAARQDAPFEHTCWNGLHEIVVPIKRDGMLVMVLFAGHWRPTVPWRTRFRRNNNETLTQAFKNLPPWNKRRAIRISNILNMFGRGLIAEVDRSFKNIEPPLTRKAKILHFLKHNAHRPVRSSDLAHAIGLSHFRTSHLVRELFGMSFQTMLAYERIQRAKVLLLSTDYSVKEIALRVGMPDEYYFNRTFHKMYGLPPRQFRLHSWPN